ncbi:MAG: hypothetical protein ACP5RN_15485, partial [Armatimonadota bacterium]
RGQGAYPEKDSAVTDANGVARFFASWDATVAAEKSLLTWTVPDVKDVSPLQIKRPAKSP